MASSVSATLAAAFDAIERDEDAIRLGRQDERAGAR